MAASEGRQSTSEWPLAEDGLAVNGTTVGSSDNEDIYMSDLARAIYEAISPDEMCLVRVPLGWKGVDLKATHPMSFMCVFHRPSDIFVKFLLTKA